MSTKLDEWKENEERLRKEGSAKIRHADAIRAEVDRLVSSGQLSLSLGDGEAGHIQ